MDFVNEWILQITRLRAENAVLLAMNNDLLEAATNLIKDVKKICPGATPGCPFTIALEAVVTRARGEKPQDIVTVENRGADAPGQW
jgi:hypothetical protein